MTTRRTAAILLGVVVAVGIGITPSAIQFFAEREVLRLQRNGLHIKVENITGFLVGIAASHVESWVGIPMGPDRSAQFPLQIRVEDVQASVHLAPLTATTSARLQGALYGGKGYATITNLFRSPLMSADLHRVDLSSHPQLSAAGIESGVVDASTTQHPLQSVWNSDATYSLAVEHLSLRPPPRVQSISGISRLTDGRIALKATVSKGGGLVINEGNFDSSLASGTIKGTSRIAPGPELTELNVTLRINLNRPDSSKVAAWLPIFTNQSVPSDVSSFACHIHSVGCRGAGAARFGASCIRASCTK